jgi:hypothetical protein
MNLSIWTANLPVSKRFLDALHLGGIGTGTRLGEGILEGVKLPLRARAASGAGKLAIPFQHPEPGSGAH